MTKATNQTPLARVWAAWQLLPNARLVCLLVAYRCESADDVLTLTNSQIADATGVHARLIPAAIMEAVEYGLIVRRVAHGRGSHLSMTPPPIPKKYAKDLPAQALRRSRPQRIESAFDAPC